MSPRAGFFCAALAVALCAGPPAGPGSAFADSGGYRRPDISAHYGSASGASSWTAPSSGGYRRPSTTGGGYSSGSAGDVAFSRSTSAQALAQYRQSQQPRRPPVETATTPDTGWGYGGYAARRPGFAPSPVAVGGSGGFGSAAFWAMLGALSASDRATYFQRSQVDPAYQQWRQQATHDPTTAARLAALGDSASAAPSGAATPAPGSGGSFIVWLVIFVGAAAFVLLWVARRRPIRPAAAATPPGISGSATTRFRVGQTIPLDPAPFLLAAGVTKVQPPPGAGMISVEAVGLLSDGQAQLHRLYLPGRTGFFQLHLGADGAPDECRYFSRLDEVQPADQTEWGQWLDPAQGMIGWPAFQTKDGQTYDRAWGPGQTRIPPRQLTETLQALGGQSQRNLQAMLYARPTGAAPPAPQGEYVMVAAVEDAGQAWVEIVAGIDVNPAALTLPAVSL
jgi:Protein of unknown function (DUF2491)